MKQADFKLPNVQLPDVQLPDFKMPDIDPQTLTYLLAGGAGALAGGTLTGMAPERPGESRMHRRWRMLRNAMLLGGAGAGGAYLLNKGINQAITQPLPADDADPTKKYIHDMAAGKVGIGTAAAGAGAGIYGKNLKEEKQLANGILADIASKDKEFKPYDAPVEALRRKYLERYSADTVDPMGSEVLKGMRDTGINRTRLDNQIRAAKRPSLLDELKSVNHPPVDRNNLLSSLGTRLKSQIRSGGKVVGKHLATGMKEHGGALMEDAAINARRLSGVGRHGGVGSRLKLLGLAAAVPAIAAYLTRDSAQQ